MATLLLSLGVHLKLVQKRMDHVDVSITLNTYSYVVPSIEGRTASAMENLLEDLKE